MKKLILITSLTLLAACSGKKDANKKNFSAAMQQYFDKKGQLCLPSYSWPVEVSEFDLRMQKNSPTGKASQMAALETAGLARSEEAMVEIIGIMGAPTGNQTKVLRYTLTDNALPFVREKKSMSFNPLHGSKEITETALCWGHKELGEIVKWEGPVKFGDYQEAKITYTYKIKSPAKWTDLPEVQTAFPSVSRNITGMNNKEDTHVVSLTSEGWEAKGLN